MVTIFFLSFGAGSFHILKFEFQKKKKKNIFCFRIFLGMGNTSSIFKEVRSKTGTFFVPRITEWYPFRDPEYIFTHSFLFY